MDNTTHRLMFGSTSGEPIGQQDFLVSGTSTTRIPFVVPPNVRTLCAVLAGAGRRGLTGDSSAQKGGPGGAGGDLRWINDLPVVPGETLIFNVESAFGYGSTYIEGVRNGVTVRLLVAGAGSSGSTPFGPGPYGGTVGGGNGGLGGNGSTTVGSTSGGGGGGAGGYSGNGGRGADAQSGGANGGTGGGGGGGGSNSRGGGVGLLGEGKSGTAFGGEGSPPGGYGAGGPGSVSSSFVGTNGAGRAMWGPFRSYPSTKTTDQFA